MPKRLPPDRVGSALGCGFGRGEDVARLVGRGLGCGRGCEVARGDGLGCGRLVARGEGRGSGAGALVGMVAGAVGLFCIQQYTKTHGFLYAGVGIVICFAVGYLASRVLPSQAKDLEGLTIHTPRPGDG